MILTVTLNPAIDKRYVVERLRPGEVLRVKECTASAGGKGLNVARAAALAGADVLATGFLGGFAGQFVEDALRRDGVAADFMRVPGETRSCINLYDETAGQQTEFLEPGEPITPVDWQAFLKKFTQLAQQSDIVTISGSAPKNTPADYYVRLIQIAKRLEKPVLLDTSGPMLRESLKAGPTLIKPNSDEIAQLTGRAAQDELLAAARALRAEGPEIVVISLGKAGALLCCNAGLFRGVPPAIQAVNTVGCGDSMIAAFAVGLQRGLPPAELLRFALALSAASAMHPKTGCFDPADTARIFDQCTVEKLA